MRYLFLFIVTINTYYAPVFSQINSWKESEKIIGVKTQFGYIFSQHPGMRHLQAHVPMLEVNFNIPTKGNKTWHKLYRYPSMGIAYVYANLGNIDVTGTAHAVMPYLRLPIIKTKHFEWNYRFAFGIGYLSKHFDRINNIENIAIGSAFNIAVNLLFDFHFKVNKKFILSSGIGLSHFSNASFQTPNLGFNIPSLSLGCYYQFSKPKQILWTTDSVSQPPQKKINVMLITSYSLKNIYPPGSRLYSVYTISTDVSYKITKRRKIGIGSDLIYDQSLLPRAISDTSYHALLNNGVNYKAGINISETLIISKLQVSLQMGVYIARKYNEGQDFYHRFGLRYNVTKHLIANLSLRTHFAKADCLEWGMGYQF